MGINGRVSGKSALVTGGSRGIGAAIAERFASEGANVMITYAGNHAAAGRVVARLRSEGVTADAVQADASQSRGSPCGRPEDTSCSWRNRYPCAQRWHFRVCLYRRDGRGRLHRRTKAPFSVNVDAVVAMTKATIPYFPDGGRVIIVGSVNAHQMLFPGTSVYGASKAAAAALGRGRAHDLGHRRILVNVIQPGPIETDMNPNDQREAVRHMTAMTALKRYGQPSEVAALAAFLASDDASYITGTTIDIDGGFSI